MTRDELAQIAERATNALADIATMQDLALIQRKAQRIYAEIRAVWHGPGAEDDAPDDERP
jgi:hypothetical protein